MTTHKQPQHAKASIFMFAMLGIALGIGVVIGKVWSTQDFVQNEDGIVEIDKVLDLYAQTRSSEVSFDQFWTIWDQIKDRHVNAEIRDVDLFYGAIEGLVASLDDPYSVYFPPEIAAEFARGLAGEFEGIGAEIGMRENQLVIIAPLPGSPAESAGLLPGDAIIAIDGNETYTTSVEDAVVQIRGKKGSAVVLTVLRGDSFEAFDVSIIRDTINIPTVSWQIESDNIAYMQIGQITDSTWGEFDTAVREMLQASPSGIILDLRNNPGGLLDVSIDIASEWIPDGDIVKEQFRDETLNNTHTTTGNHRLVGIPTVVLVNNGTASGAEIIAGAMQDHNAATVVGELTFGKGSVQDFEILEDGSALKMTVAEWLTPHDRKINEVGLAPDIDLPEMFLFTDADGALLEEAIDVGFDAAIDLLTQ